MITVYHANEHRDTQIIVYARGNGQWLGDAFYFWQDLAFAEEWAKSPRNKYEYADIYTVELDLNFKEDIDVIDTVFNEQDYYKFVEKVEYFAAIYERIFERKPSLEEFNNFIQDKNIWKDIVAIRFQDLPTKDSKDYLKVKGFFYKKRIQIALFEPKKITNKTLSDTITNQKI